MKSRERVLRTLDHRNTDRVPVDFGTTNTTGIHYSAYCRLLSHLPRLKASEPGVAHTETQAAIVEDEVLAAFGTDTRPCWPRRPDYLIRPATVTEYVDEWGVLKKWSGMYYDTAQSPLKRGTVEELQCHRWPDPGEAMRFEGLKERIGLLAGKAEHAIVVDPTGSIPLGAAFALRGYEDFLVDLLLNERFAVALMDRVVDYQMALLGNLFDIAGNNVDIIKIADDLGTQQSLLMSPELYRRYIKPRHRRLVDLIKKKSRARVLMHSDGAILPIIPDLIEIGVDALNPIQTECAGMEAVRLKREFGKDLCFWGGVDQRVLVNGAKREIEEEVKRRVGELSADGGYVISVVHNIQPDVPAESVCWLFEFIKSF